MKTKLFFLALMLPSLLVVPAAYGDTSGPAGTWQLASNGYPLTATLVAGSQSGAYQGALINENGGSEQLDNIAWDATARRLEFRRNGNGFWQWYRGVVVEGIFVGRFSHSSQSSARPQQLSAFAWHATGWNSNYLDANLAPRVFEVLLNNDYRARLRIDYSPDAASQYGGRLKVYSTVSGGAGGEEVEHELEVTQWNGTNLRFVRRGEGWTQVYTGVVAGRTISGTFTHSGQPGAFPWNGKRAEVLSYGLIPKGPNGRAAWQERTRRQLFHLMMAGNPAPLTRNVTDVNCPQPPCNLPPLASAQLPSERDDNPGSWPRQYRLRELQFDYTLPNPYGNQPLARRSHAYLAVPTTPPPGGGKYPAVLAVNGHGGSAWQMMNPGSGYFWYGDAFARRGFVVLAVDISHRASGDDPDHGNVAHPPIQAPGFDSDWEEDGERAWDAMRGLDYLLSLPNVDDDRVLVTGISMGGEIATIVGALDPRIALSIPAGFSPDLGVMIYNGNHECWRWRNADTREYVDTSDFYALTAPRALIIQTGKADRTFSQFQSPFAADKQVARRTRAAYGGQGHRFIHYLHYDGHHYHAGDINPTHSTERGVRVPEVIEPTAPWSVEWQSDGRTSAERSTLFDYVAFYLTFR